MHYGLRAAPDSVQKKLSGFVPLKLFTTEDDRAWGDGSGLKRTFVLL